MERLFSPTLESEQRHITDFARIKKGFGTADRFLYVKLQKRMAACQPNVGPAEYEHHDQFKNLNKLPCSTVIVSVLADLSRTRISHCRRRS